MIFGDWLHLYYWVAMFTGVGEVKGGGNGLIKKREYNSIAFFLQKNK